MDNIKQHLPKIVIGTAGALALSYLLYKLLNRTQTAAASSHSPFTQIIDQKAPLNLKVQQAHAYAMSYISENLGVRGTLSVSAEGKLSAEDFAHLQKIMNFYAKSQLYEVKLAS